MLNKNKKANDKPFWTDYGYTPEEWRLRRIFEKKFSDEDNQSGYLADTEEFGRFGS